MLDWSPITHPEIAAALGSPMSWITPFCIHVEFQLERRFSLPVVPFPTINLSQLLMEDCKVLWGPSGWKVLIVSDETLLGPQTLT